MYAPLRAFGFALLSLGLASSCSSQSRQPSSAHASDPESQAMMGFKLEKKTPQFQLFSFRDQGMFLISTVGFTSRKEAIDFCADKESFELSGYLLPGVMTMSGLPFAELQESNLTKEKVLGGRSGLVFWILGKEGDEEKTLRRFPDSLYAMLDGCGPGCDATVPLSEVNTSLKRLGKSTLAPRAICVSFGLRDSLNKN